MNDSNEPDWARTLIAEVERSPTPRLTEGDLRNRGIDPATVRRYFQKQFGMTFHAYARARRLTDAFSQIRNGEAVEPSSRASGYESESAFRKAFERTFGTTPGKSRSGDCVRLTWLSSPLGPLMAGAANEGICLLEFTDRRMIEAQVRTVRSKFGLPLVPGSNRHLEQLRDELQRYFAGTLKRFAVPIREPGSAFQMRVWNALCEIPYGETRSYREIAERIGDRRAVRAVGRANGMNRIAIVVPCHRVVNANGDLGGYGGGLRRKQFLLNWERDHTGRA